MEEEVIKGKKQTLGACSQPMMQKATSKAKLRYLGARLGSSLEGISPPPCEVGAENPDSWCWVG